MSGIHHPGYNFPLYSFAERITRVLRSLSIDIENSGCCYVDASQILYLCRRNEAEV